MSPRQVRTVVSVLLQKGFIEEVSGDHIRLYHCINGRRTGIRTFYSHGAKELNDYILGRMAKHLRLSRAQFDALIDCTLGMEAYIEILKGLGEI